VERPQRLWELDADDESLLRLLGEMISAALVRNGGDLAHVVLNVSNVIVPPEAAGGSMPLGDFVAMTIRSHGDWSPEVARQPIAGAHPLLVNADLEAAALRARVVYGYTRVLGRDEGSVTVFFARSV
jgi:hypothetical protein